MAVRISQYSPSRVWCWLAVVDWLSSIDHTYGRCKSISPIAKRKCLGIAWSRVLFSFASQLRRSIGTSGGDRKKGSTTELSNRDTAVFWLVLQHWLSCTPCLLSRTICHVSLPSLLSYLYQRAELPLIYKWCFFDLSEGHRKSSQFGAHRHKV